jgi:hypothetical protein
MRKPGGGCWIHEISSSRHGVLPLPDWRANDLPEGMRDPLLRLVDQFRKKLTEEVHTGIDLSWYESEIRGSRGFSRARDQECR